ELLIKGLSYFNVAQKEDEENKNIYYLKSIRVLTEAITEAIYKDNINELNSILFYHLAYSYLLFGEEYFAISLNYFNHAEKLNNEDKLLMKGKREGKIYLLELFEISGSVYFQLGQYKNTIEYFDKAKTLNSDNILYDLVLAKSYYEIGEYEKSYEYYNFVLNNYDKEKTYKNEIINDEIIEQIKLHIPRLQYLMKNYHSAISYYKKYIKEYGDSAELRYIIGKIYETLSFIENNKQKQKEYINKAIEQWKKSIIIKPDYGRSMLKLWRYNAQI
ncbi:MAG: CDC27 family protein, partial [Spirochaetota bacterium]